MRLIIQRATRGAVTVAGQTVGSIGRGLVVLVGLSRTDHEADLDVLARKLLNIRLFDAAPAGDAWSSSVMQTKGDLLLVSQFTLYGIPKGNKPDFHLAMSTEPANALFSQFVSKVRNGYKGGNVATGVFGADMQVEIVNDGPVTLSLSTDDLDLSKEREKIDKARAKYGAPKVKGAAAAAAAGSSAPATAAASSDSSVTPSSSPAIADAASPAPAASSPASSDSASTSSSSAASSASAASTAPAAAAPAATIPAAATAGSAAKSATNGTAGKGSAGSARAFSTSASPPQPATVHAVPAPSAFSDLVGHTSLIRLRRISEATGCDVYGKAEFENPGGSIKDRAATAILAAAEAEGKLVHGQPGWIVEGTAGNTGIGLALAGASRGYSTLVVLADNNSAEKKAALRAIGATLLEVPQVPFSNPNNYVHVAARVFEALQKRCAAQNPPVRVILADQWSNAANRAAHQHGTGPEIWAQTGGKIDAFCCGVGTGGTLTGTSLFLRSVAPRVQCWLVDPDGSALKSHFETGELRCSDGSSISEGIGQGRLPDNLVRGDFRPDGCVRVSDAEALPLAYELLQEEGLSIGTSSVINIAGAYKVARQLGPGHTIVTVLADGGGRYASKLASAAFLREKGLPIPPWLDDTHEDTRSRNAMAKELMQQAMLQAPQQP